MPKDDYTKVDCTIVRLSDNAVLIEQDGEEHWIPRSLFHAGTDEKLEEGEETTIKIRAWKVEQVGLESHD